MNNRPILLALTLGLTLLAACEDKNATSMSSSGAVSATATPSMTAAPPAMTANAATDPLPSHADVAATVRTEVTKQNYKAELDKLEKSADE